ncbi:hypothetical protein [Delftia lacustris]|uniref:hypothetical protein n=1 Tax=Delftia lacustris TaxID=558537 RepID=UPI00115F8215
MKHKLFLFELDDKLLGSQAPHYAALADGREILPLLKLQPRDGLARPALDSVQVWLCQLWAADSTGRCDTLIGLLPVSMTPC